jgi:hypothetical protein
MRLIEKLEGKRDAAHAEYLKWQGMIDTLQNDPEFASTIHRGAVAKMNGVHKLVAVNGNGNGNGHATGVGLGFDHSAAAKKGWTPERRAEYSARMKGQGVPQKKKKHTKTLTAAQRKAIGARLKKLHKDPKWQAKRLRNLRKVLKAKKAARQVTPVAEAQA